MTLLYLLLLSAPYQQPSLTLEFFVVFLGLTQCHPEVRPSIHYSCRYTNANVRHHAIANTEFIVVFKKNVTSDTIDKHGQELSNAGTLYNAFGMFLSKIGLIEVSVRVEDRWLDSQQVRL